MAAKDISDFLSTYQGNMECFAFKKALWDTAAETAVEKFTSTNSAMDAMRRIVAARNNNADILPFFAAIVDIVDEYAAINKEVLCL